MTCEADPIVTSATLHDDIEPFCAEVSAFPEGFAYDLPSSGVPFVWSGMGATRGAALAALDAFGEAITTVARAQSLALGCLIAWGRR